MATNNKYRIWCVTEAAYIYEWATAEPTDCPNDAGHTIDATQTTITETEPIEIYTTFNFYDALAPYVWFDDETWKACTAFIYQGSDTLPISKIDCMVSREGDAGVAHWRLWDVTNSTELGTDSWTSVGQQKSSGTLSNVPTGEAMLELQVKLDESSDKSRIWSCTILRSP